MRRCATTDVVRCSTSTTLVAAAGAAVQLQLCTTYCCCALLYLVYTLVLWMDGAVGQTHQANPTNPTLVQYAIILIIPDGSFKLLRGAVVNRTYGIHKKTRYLGIFTDNIWSY